jgi:hypothetical protein
VWVDEDHPALDNHIAQAQRKVERFKVLACCPGRADHTRDPVSYHAAN